MKLSYAHIRTRKLDILVRNLSYTTNQPAPLRDPVHRMSFMCNRDSWAEQSCNVQQHSDHLSHSNFLSTSLPQTSMLYKHHFNRVLDSYQIWRIDTVLQQLFTGVTTSWHWPGFLQHSRLVFSSPVHFKGPQQPFTEFSFSCIC